MSTRNHWMLGVTALAACVAKPPDAPGAQAPAVPTAANPFAGLPALSGDGQTIVLPTFTAADAGQERSITFINVGDTESAGTTLNIPADATDAFFDNLNAVLTDKKYAALPWTLTPDEPPLPMDMVVGDTKLSFRGDARAQVVVDVMAGGRYVGKDVYQLEAESQTSPEHVVAVGATVVWRDDRGFAYVRYDVNRGTARDSGWRVIVLQKPPVAAPEAAK